MLGLSVLLDGVYRITSNRESGEGRYDIQMLPKKKDFPGILIELKALKDATEEQLQQVACEALRQIEDKKYDEEMRGKGIVSAARYGVAFSGKRVQVSSSYGILNAFMGF